MGPIYIIAAVALLIAQLALPMRYAFLPLLIAGCNLGNIEIAGDLTVLRMLIALGLMRAMAAKQLTWTWKDPLDRLLLIFSVILVLSSVGHEAGPFSEHPFIFRAGMAFNIFGTYLYARAYFRSLASLWTMVMALPVILLPLACGMLVEQRTGNNLYYPLGAINSISAVRDGKIRAVGPFRHPILAGCAGATALPFAFLLMRRREKGRGFLLFFACFGVTFASASSGPLAAFAVAIFARMLWGNRRFLKHLLWAIVALGLLFWVVKGRGPWYLMASIDLVGGSTGWHRAYLIDQGLTYFNEWWLFGTDYTRHWMASGVSWNPDAVDITNYYLHVGVIGGFGVTFCLFAMLVSSFRRLGRRMKEMRRAGDPNEFWLWCVGTSLACHAISFVSISYFDQMYIIFYMLLGSIPLLVQAPPETPPEEPEPEEGVGQARPSHTRAPWVADAFQRAFLRDSGAAPSKAAG